MHMHRIIGGTPELIARYRGSYRAAVPPAPGLTQISEGTWVRYPGRGGPNGPSSQANVCKAGRNVSAVQSARQRKLDLAREEIRLMEAQIEGERFRALHEKR